MYHQKPDNPADSGHLRVLESVEGSPLEAYQTDEEVRAAFDAELRRLAEEIVEFHPSLTQLLLSLGNQGMTNPVHGQN